MVSGPGKRAGLVCHNGTQKGSKTTRGIVFDFKTGWGLRPAHEPSPPDHSDKARRRFKAGLRRSSNLALTLDAARQGVIDLRCCLAGSSRQATRNSAIIGTSMG